MAQPNPADDPRPVDDPLYDLRARLTDAERESRRLRRELEQVRSSTSFRLGHALVRTAARLWPSRRTVPAAREAGAPPTAPATAGGGASAQPARRAPLLPGLGPDRDGAVLLDATGVDAAVAAAAARALADHGHAVTLVHPAPPESVAAEEVHGLERVPAELAARFGPARTVRAVAASGDRPALLARDTAPLQQVVDEVGDASGLPPGPVFIGGTGRSGTWVLGRMLAAHPRVVTVHTELRFHSSRPGFAAVLAGELDPEAYARIVQRKWFRPAGGSGNAKGIQLLSGNRELRRTLAAFTERAGTDVPGALGQLMLDVVGPYARGRGALRWAETTPDNAAAAHALTTVLPSAQVVHSVRDGRDVAASVVTMPWGPDTHLEGLDWWANRLREAHAGMTRADPDRAHTVRLEELIHVDREEALDRLLTGLGFTDDGPVRHYFDREMRAEHSHLGRWRGELDAAERDAFDGRYRELLAELDAEGVTCLPADPDTVDELARG